MNDKKRRIDPAGAAVVGFLGIIILMISFVALGDDFPLELWVLLFVIVCAIMMGGFIGTLVQNKNDKDQLIQNMDEFQREYDVYTEKLGVVKNEATVTLIELDQYNFKVKIPQYMWISEGVLRIFPRAEFYKRSRTTSEHKADVLTLQIKSIPIDSILYFEEIGELHKYVTVSGGGYSVEGAYAGHFLGDDIGAVIGSRVPIESKVVSEDDRAIELIYKDRSGNVQNLEFDHDSYKILKKMIPSKELRLIVGLSQSQGQAQAQVQVQPNSDVAAQPQTTRDKLKELNDMKAEGLITEEEYSEQKKKLLDSFASN